MTFNIARIRADFPSLKNGWAFFDGPGGTQTPVQVTDAITDALAQPLSNRGAVTEGERNAERIVVDARRAIADLVGGDPRGVVFGRSATQLAYDFSRMLSASWEPGDEVIVTRLDHDSNIRPWVQAAERAGATVRWVNFDQASSELDLDQLAGLLNDRTRLVAVTAASNIIGTIPPVAEISRLAHQAGALVYVDGVHYTAHESVDIAALGADFYSCSPYKFLGPHLGVLAADPVLLDGLRPDKLLPSTDEVPERFEFGTLPYEYLAAVTAAIGYLAELSGSTASTRRQRLIDSYTALGRHEADLRSRLEAGVAELAGVTVHSRAEARTPTMLITFDGRNAADAYTHLARVKIAAPASNFYALEASRHLGLGDAGGLRVGLAPYNTVEEVDRLVDGLRDFLLG
ncbi:MAG: cysteine desulfurase-like protein [Homoserinimonas sp.]